MWLFKSSHHRLRLISKQHLRRHTHSLPTGFLWNTCDKICIVERLCISRVVTIPPQYFFVFYMCRPELNKKGNFNHIYIRLFSFFRAVSCAFGFQFFKKCSDEAVFCAKNHYVPQKCILLCRC